MQTYAILWPIHGVLMGLSFLLMLTAMLIARYAKKRRWWYTVHKRLNITGALGAAVALIIAVVMVSLSHGYHLLSTHAILGAVTFLFIVVTPFFGFAIRSRKVPPARKKAVRHIHHWLGRTTLLLMAVTIFFGLSISGIL
jgi:Kef-type K+ transport system membrane component KefB